MNSSIIGHIDADCFYVSCERLRDSRLKNKPVAVLGNQGACVIARSYEMKPYGIKVGMPIWKAKQLCPDGIHVKRDFQWYEILSRKMQEILCDFSHTVEYYSVDESFVDFGAYPGDLNELALTIQKRILKEVGVPVSIGISVTRTLAKMASEKNKPLGIQIVRKEDILKFLKDCSPQEIPGIGRKLIKRIGFFQTVLDYIQEPQAGIRSLLHKPGEELWYELQGISLYPIRSKRPQRKVISRGGSIWGYHKDPNYIWGFLMRNLERLISQLVKEEIEVGDLTLLLVTADGLTFKSTQKFPDYTNVYSHLLQALNRAFQKAFSPSCTYGYVHIICGMLNSSSKKQLNLFTQEDEKDQKVALVKQMINSKHGLFTIRSGSTAYVSEVFQDETSNYEIVDIDGKICF